MRLRRNQISGYFSFQWHITDDCDQRCRHCYIYGRDQNQRPQAMALEDMETVLANCEKMAERFERAPNFFITGGDPLLHPDFWSLASLLKDRGICFSILGNPFHLTGEVCERLADAGCERYQLSLDGLEQTHDWFRKRGSFQATLETLPLLKKAGIETAIIETAIVNNPCLKAGAL